MFCTKLFLVFCIIHHVWGFSVHHPLVGIVRGHKISISDAPHPAVLVRYIEKITDRVAKRFICGGSIIHERFILTAAHCILMGQSFRDHIRVGSSHLNEGGTIYEVEKFITHENCTERNGFSAFTYDVALVKLKTSLNFSETVAKIALADKNVKLEPFTMANVTGWGKTDANGPVSEDLMQASVKIKPIDECKMFPWMNENLICVSSYASSCKGDSGGPMTLGDVQVGIVSMGLGCGYTPTTYTKVSFVRSWIIENINKHL